MERLSQCIFRSAGCPLPRGKGEEQHPQEERGHSQSPSALHPHNNPTWAGESRFLSTESGSFLLVFLLHRGDGDGFSEEQLQMYKDCFKLMDINKVHHHPLIRVGNERFCKYEKLMLFH